MTSEDEKHSEESSKKKGLPLYDGLRLIDTNNVSI